MARDQCTMATGVPRLTQCLRVQHVDLHIKYCRKETITPLSSPAQVSPAFEGTPCDSERDLKLFDGVPIASQLYGKQLNDEELLDCKRAGQYD